MYVYVCVCVYNRPNHPNHPSTWVLWCVCLSLPLLRVTVTMRMTLMTRTTLGSLRQGHSPLYSFLAFGIVHQVENNPEHPNNPNSPNDSPGNPNSPNLSSCSLGNDEPPTKQKEQKGNFFPPEEENVLSKLAMKEASVIHEATMYVPVLSFV